MAPLNPVASRKHQVMLAAARRWQARSSNRSSDGAVIATLGPGAADSPTKQARFAERREILTQAVGLRARGQLPFFIERKIGPTLDFLSGPPSEAARKAGQPVARIVTTVDPRYQAEGMATGFLIAPTILLTNWHVFPEPASALGTGANFLHEEGEHGLQLGPTFPLVPDDFFVSDERLDFALVGVHPMAVGGERLADLGVLPLTAATSRVLKGQPVDIIQYPDGGRKEYATRNNRLVDILDEGFIHYETDTLEGSSGAPAFSDSWELIALHHAGIPEVRDGLIIATDGRPWSEDMGDDRVRWVANEGIRASAIVRALAEVRMPEARQADMLAELLAGATDPADDVAALLNGGTVAPEMRRLAATVPAAIGGATRMTGANFTFSGPVTIHVYAGETATAPPPAPAAVAAPEATLRFDPNYDDREGYDPDFLGPGMTVPPPSVSPGRDGEIYKEDGKVVVLKYHHYSLAMNRARRLQMWSAANVDYDPSLRAQGGRASFGMDRWIGDPRIPASLQIRDPDFYGPASQIDRGHIVRREDSAWGRTPLELEFANSDTFHWTNCTPQHQAFNRESPGANVYGPIKGLWGAFEAYVQRSLQQGDTKACILAGPILAPDDPTADFGTGPVQYPVRFWKVVVVTGRDPDAGGLRAYGFVLAQRDVVDRFGIEFAPGQYARYQTALADIAGMAGLVFDQVLLDADAKASPTAAA